MTHTLTRHCEGAIRGMQVAGSPVSLFRPSRLLGEGNREQGFTRKERRPWKEK
jgi:hypothetical protein